MLRSEPARATSVDYPTLRVRSHPQFDSLSPKHNEAVAFLYFRLYWIKTSLQVNKCHMLLHNEYQFPV